MKNEKKTNKKTQKYKAKSMKLYNIGICFTMLVYERRALRTH
jgi:hypothetical protein